jgi:hypothetical protein
MTTSKASAADRAWAMIEDEKRRDRFVRKVSVVAWSATFAIVILFTIMVGIQVAEMVKAGLMGAVPWMAAVGVATPLIVVLGFLSLLIATLSTVGVFLRQRTASLAEIQLRLAALEDMLAASQKE